MNEREEWGEDLLDPDVYSVALEKARKIAGSMREAWEYLLPVYERLASVVRRDVRELSESHKEYGVIAVDSTFSPTLSLRGLRAGFILLAAVTYPKPSRPIFRLKPVRSGLRDEDEDPSDAIVSVRAKKEELLLIRDILIHRGDYDVVVRDGDLPPADAVLELRRRTGITSLSHEVLELAKKKDKGLVGLVKRISTSLIAYRYLGMELLEIMNSRPEGVPQGVAWDLLSDPVLAWLMLDPGEFLSVGKYGEEFDGMRFIVSYFSSMVRGKEKYIKRMNKRLEEYPLFNEVEVSFYRPRASGAPVVKLTGFNVDMWGFSSFSAGSTRGPSYPDFINLADTACIEHARSIRPEMVMLDALRVASESEGLSRLKFRGRRADLVSLQNVQKLHLFYRRE